MKLIKLEILNLASLDRQGGEVIDFENGALGNSNIFSIVGPTGSGKSTILDAICLALYNLAPRYPKTKGARNQSIEIYGEKDDNEKNRIPPTDGRNILTRGKKEGYSKLTFLANNGNIYRAEWHVSIARVNYNDVNTQLYQITQSNGKLNEDLDDWDKIPQIIGLDYEQFLRTVLIAQGSFANFLKANEEDKFKLLEKLIGCEEQYTRIAEEIKNKKEDAVYKYTQLNSQYSVFENSIIPQEELATLTERIKQLEEEEKKVKAELQKVSEALNWYTREEKHIADIATYDNALKEARQKLDAMKAEIELLEVHDSTLPAAAIFKDIKSNEGTAKSLEGKLKELNGTFQNLTETIQNEEKGLEILTQNVKNANQELENQRPHINKARSIKGELLSVKKSVVEKDTAQKESEKALGIAKKNLADNAEAIKTFEAELKKTTEDFNNLKADIDTKKENLAQTVKDATSKFEAEKKKNEGKNATLLQEAKAKAEKEQRDLEKAIEILKKIRDVSTTLENNDNKTKQLTARNKEIEDALTKLTIKSLREELDTLTRTQTLMTSEKWEHHRANLSDGQPCPLCGSTHHPYQNNSALQPVLDDLQKLISEKSSALEEQTNQEQVLTKEQAQNQGKIDELVRNSEKTQKDLQELNKQRSDGHASYPDWPDDADTLEKIFPSIKAEAEKATSELKTYNNIVENIEKLRKIKENAEKKQNDYSKQAEKQLRVAEEKKTNADTNLKTEKGKTENLQKQEKEKELALANDTEAWKKAKEELIKKENALKDEIGEKDPDTFEQQLTEAKQKAENAVNKKNEEIGKLREELSKVKGNIETTENSQKETTEKLAQNKTKLGAWIIEYNAKHAEKHISADTIAQISNATNNWEAIRNHQKQASEAFTTAQTTYNNELKAHTDHQAAKPTDSKDTLLLQKTDLENKSNEELVNSKARMQKHDEAQKQMGTMLNQMNDTKCQKEEWEQIYSAIGSDGKTLRKIAQCYTLNFLVAHANAEIRKFNSRYELVQVKNSLGIRVIDHDRADDIRDITSLSGGETFIVSLGLALGLSSLSSKNISFGNLFIDEGFGTLDPDTLAIVIDSLANLQSSQGKKVGVISHTDTMSERITTQIRIIKNGNSGSSHIEIYP